MLELAQVARSYDGVPALFATDLRLEAGRTTVLIGPSGCGKSTLLRIVIGLVRPDAGEVRFEGRRVTQADLAGLRARMGYVIQDGGLFPHLTARGNACLMARHLGWSPDRMAARLEELRQLTHFPLEGLERFPLQLSGGQRQRVSLMRALMLDPDVLLLDEPLGALDPMIRFELQEELRGIFAELQKTVVLVTHDLAEARHFADSIVLMNEGRVVQQGAPAELFERPADGFVRQFLRAQRGIHGGEA